MNNSLRRLLRRFLDTFLPPQCAGCGRPGILLCPACVDRIERVEPPICPICGRHTPQTGRCFVCTRQPLPLNAIRAAAVYQEPLKPLIHAFKYENRFALAEPLAALMTGSWPSWQNGLTGINLVLAIPLHRERKKERGYNQAHLLAREFAAQVDLPLSRTGLDRIRTTRPQVNLAAAERQRNVHGAFKADPDIVSGRHVLLIDDVLTTGATLTAAAEATLKAGAERVSAYCLARAA